MHKLVLSFSFAHFQAPRSQFETCFFLTPRALSLIFNFRRVLLFSVKFERKKMLWEMLERKKELNVHFLAEKKPKEN